MSLSAYDDFMNPIVAGRASCCLETLVPILGGDGRDESRPYGTPSDSRREASRTYSEISSTSGPVPELAGRQSNLGA
jgi:hypothetical protein